MEEFGGIIIGIIIIGVLLYYYWEYILAIGFVIFIIYVIYKWGKAEEERRSKEGKVRAKEARNMAQHLKDDIQCIVMGIRYPDWDSPQGGEILSAVFSASADNAILLGELMAENVMET